MKGVHFWDPNVKKKGRRGVPEGSGDGRGAQEPKEELGSGPQILQKHHLPPARGGISPLSSPSTTTVTRHERHDDNLSSCRQLSHS